VEPTVLEIRHGAREVLVMVRAGGVPSITSTLSFTIKSVSAILEGVQSSVQLTVIAAISVTPSPVQLYQSQYFESLGEDVAGVDVFLTPSVVAFSDISIQAVMPLGTSITTGAGGVSRGANSDVFVIPESSTSGREYALRLYGGNKSSAMAPVSFLVSTTILLCRSCFAPLIYRFAL
jgi:hypothetical protein